LFKPNPERLNSAEVLGGVDGHFEGSAASSGTVKPFYEREGIVIFCGDCRDVLPRLRARGLPLVDMVLADPPYGETELPWDRRVDGWLSLVAPHLKPSGSLWCFGSFRLLVRQMEELLRHFRIAQEVVWEKHNGSGFATDRFRRVHELVLQVYARRARWSGVWKETQYSHDAKAVRVQTRRKKRSMHVGRIVSEPYVSHDGGPRLMRSVLRVPSCHGYATNSTQKPLGILAPLISYSCPKGGVVLDPMMGSGSSLIAARALGRRVIGIEIREAECETAVARLRGADVSTRLEVNDPRQGSLF
jgi:site-specific DNA-methyltransferase (adenine-specific)